MIKIKEEIGFLYVKSKLCAQGLFLYLENSIVSY